MYARYWKNLEICLLETCFKQNVLEGMVDTGGGIGLKKAGWLAAAWVDLEMTILNEVSQTEEGKHHVISFKRGI